MASRILLPLVFALFTSAAFAQGSIGGTITDAKTGEAIIGANVVIQGTTVGTATDIEGKFLISNVAAGTYNLQVSYITYKTTTVPDVIVENAKRVTIDVPISEEAQELGEVVVRGTRQTDTDFDMLRTIKEQKVIAVGISAEQISKSLDRDAAQVLRRVPGITIKGDQFVQIRGLSERYNAVMLHNAYAPSVETDVRSFSFATLPSSQLDRVIVYKSPAADIPGDFAGGVVKVFTKSIPEENSFVVDYSTQYRAGTTFNDYYSQKKDDMHFTGFNTGAYNLPANFPKDVNNVHNGDQLINVGRSLPNTWVPVKGTAIPDQRLSLTFSRKFNVGKMQIGNISAINYSNTYSIFKVTRNDYTDSPNSIDQNFGYADLQNNQQVRTGFLFNWAFKFNPQHIIEFKNLYNQSSNDQFVNRTGTGISTGQLNGNFDKVYRGIYSGQLLGTHDLFNDKTKIEWVAGYNSSNRDQPDYRRYRTNLDGQSGQVSVQVPNTVDPNFLGRFFSKMNESAYSGGLSVKQLFNTENPLLSPEIKVGGFYEHKERSFSARNIGYKKSGTTLDPALVNLPIGELMQPQNINNNGGLAIGEQTYKKNSYSAQNDLLAGYVMGSVPVGQKLKIDAGVRVENNIQQLHSYDDFKNQAVDPKFDITRVLPSANVSFNFTEKSLIRAAYGETLNRPEFRELAPFSYYDFNFNFLYIGNPGLKTAKIQNVDVRYELFPTKSELITIGGFYKKFTNPIEFVIDVNSPGGGLKNVNFMNADGATSYGVELEVKKSLQGLTNSQILDNINVMVNATLIKSNIQINNPGAGMEANRPMQGQAPYVVNAALFYNNEDSGWQINALYNVVGKNIAFVGNENYHTVYQMPRNVLDLTFSKRLGERFTLKGGISDLINQPILFLQDGKGDGLNRKKDEVIQSYKPGQVFSLGFSFRI